MSWAACFVRSTKIGGRATPRKVLSRSRVTAATTIGAPETRARFAAIVGNAVSSPKNITSTLSSSFARGPRSIIRPTISFRRSAWSTWRTAPSGGRSLTFLCARFATRRSMRGGAARARLRPASPRTPSREPVGRASLARCPAQRLLTRAPLDVFLHALTRPVVGDLARRRLHEVRRWSHDRAPEVSVKSELAAADCVDHHAGTVGGVPDLELDLRVQRDVAEGRALHADVAPLAVEEPRDVVRRADMNVLRVHRIVEHARHRVRLADLLRLEALPLEHVQEIGVAAEVQLVGAVETHAAVHEEAREHALRDRGADL